MKKFYLFVMDISAAILMLCDRFAYIYNGNCTSLGYWMVRICNFLGCDMDFLFGHIDLKTHDAQFIHEHTGLSEKAIEKLFNK